MLRFKILASTVPLMVAGVFARIELPVSAQPCIRLGETSVQLAPAPGQAQRQVAFTTDPTRATVRVQIVDSAEAADFAYVDDINGSEAATCAVTAATRLVAIADGDTASGPLIYLSNDDHADYRIFIRSQRFTPRQAAALIVGALDTGAPSAAAAL